ncbi:MAG: hypothetical protein DRR06_15845, partial [Gammaproteobacteria bacterium]
NSDEPRSIIAKYGKLSFRGFAKDKPEIQKRAAKTFIIWAKDHDVDLLDDKRREVFIKKCSYLRQHGHKATVSNLHGGGEAPRSYFETDEDPYRYSLHENDKDLHDVHIIVEPEDPDADPEMDAMLPNEFTVRFYTGRHKVARFLIDPDLPNYDLARQNSNIFRTFIDQHQLHVGTYINATLGTDHDMADTEWDLGMDLASDEEALSAEELMAALNG